ncbi:EAL domain-containing protein [bacterium BFN5]|nr:EAL domain-containing protein [bacterium BFN5]
MGSLSVYSSQFSIKLPGRLYRPGCDDEPKSLEKTAFPKDCLTLEIVETMLIENFNDVTGKIYDLKKLGVSISLDDFGTGYSSLTYLSELPVNTIKIDKSFVDALLEKSNYAAIVGTVIQLAHEMGFDVVAEGVETREQMLFLLELKCDRMQGYFISKPLPEETIWEKYC